MKISGVFLLQTTPCIKACFLFSLILLSPMQALNLLKFQSLTKVLWAALVLPYPSTVLVAIIIFGYSLKNAPPRLQILVIPKDQCTLPHKLICLLDSLYTNLSRHLVKRHLVDSPRVVKSLRA